jgi:hypothetical protein
VAAQTARVAEEASFEGKRKSGRKSGRAGKQVERDVGINPENRSRLITG